MIDLLSGTRTSQVFSQLVTNDYRVYAIIKNKTSTIGSQLLDLVIQGSWNDALMSRL
ncbi:hypothetical protein HanIR_Chr08g0363521 [Helianthus annuus]|nr:hypothetical protein HanIR_Chr08g0363521 [Helianthus annuus]